MKEKIKYLKKRVHLLLYRPSSGTRIAR